MSARKIKAGEAYILLGIRDRMVRGLRAAQTRLRNFGQGISTIGAAVAGAGTVVVGALAGMVRQFAATGDQLDKMRARTGFSAASLSELGFAAEQGGASIDQLDRSLGAMARFSVMVERDLSSATDVLDMLGVSVESFKSASPEERFKLLAEAISKVKDPTVKAGLALNVFGRSGRELLPMLENGAAGIEALQAEARRLGITLTDEDASSAAELTDAMNRLHRQFQAIIVQIGGALAPLLVQIQQNVAPLIAQVIGWVRENQALIVTIAKVAAIVAAVGAAIVVAGGVIVGISAVLGGLATIAGAVVGTISTLVAIVGAILSPVGLLLAAIVGLAGAFLYFSGAGANAISFVSEQLTRLLDFVRPIVQGIKDALAAKDLRLAAEVLWKGLRVAWLRGVAELTKVWVGFKLMFVEVFDAAANWVENRMIDLVVFMGEKFLDLQVQLGKLTEAQADAAKFGIGIATAAWRSANQAATEQNREDREKQAAKDIKAAEKDVGAANADLRRALAEAKRKRAEAEAKALEAEKPPPLPDFTTSAPTLDKGSSVGTFSARGAQLLGGNTDERTAKATEELVRLTKEWIREVRLADGLTFGA